MNDKEAAEYLSQRGILRDPLDSRSTVELADLHRVAGTTALTVDVELPAQPSVAYTREWYPDDLTW